MCVYTSIFIIVIKRYARVVLLTLALSLASIFAENSYRAEEAEELHQLFSSIASLSSCDKIFSFLKNDNNTF
jgi:hypothetical protein